MTGFVGGDGRQSHSCSFFLWWQWKESQVERFGFFTPTSCFPCSVHMYRMISLIPHVATSTTLYRHVDDLKCISDMDEQDKLVLLSVLLLTPAFENCVWIDQTVLGRGRRGRSKLPWLQLLNALRAAVSCVDVWQSSVSEERRWSAGCVSFHCPVVRLHAWLELRLAAVVPLVGSAQVIGSSAWQGACS